MQSIAAVKRLMVYSIFTSVALAFVIYYAIYNLPSCVLKCSPSVGLSIKTIEVNNINVIRPQEESVFPRVKDAGSTGNPVGLIAHDQLASSGA